MVQDGAYRPLISLSSQRPLSSPRLIDLCAKTCPFPLNSTGDCETVVRASSTSSMELSTHIPDDPFDQCPIPPAPDYEDTGNEWVWLAWPGRPSRAEQSRMKDETFVSESDRPCACFFIHPTTSIPFQEGHPTKVWNGECPSTRPLNNNPVLAVLSSPIRLPSGRQRGVRHNPGRRGHAGLNI